MDDVYCFEVQGEIDLDFSWTTCRIYKNKLQIFSLHILWWVPNLNMHEDLQILQIPSIIFKKKKEQSMSLFLNKETWNKKSKRRHFLPSNPKWTGHRVSQVWDPRTEDPVLSLEPVEGETPADCWTVAFGNSYNDAERCIAAGQVAERITYWFIYGTCSERSLDLDAKKLIGSHALGWPLFGGFRQDMTMGMWRFLICGCLRWVAFTLLRSTHVLKEALRRTNTLRWDTNVRNGVCHLQFATWSAKNDDKIDKLFCWWVWSIPNFQDRKDIRMNKLGVSWI